VHLWIKPVISERIEIQSSLDSCEPRVCLGVSEVVLGNAKPQRNISTIKSDSDLLKPTAMIALIASVKNLRN